MPTHRLKTIRFLISATALFAFAAGDLRAWDGPVWQRWTRVCLSKDMSTEWLIANDKDSNGLLTPQQTTIYLLVPPTITPVGRHWEITFDSTGAKKNKLAEHFDVTQASDPFPSGYHGAPRITVNWSLYGGDRSKPYCPWLIISSKEFWAGQREPLNLDPQHTGSPTTYNLDPNDALGIAFLEPTVTEKDGEWLLTTTSIPTDQQMAFIASDYADWNRQHPGPRSPTIRKETYPPGLQKEYDAWWAALKEWQANGAHGLSPRFEDYFLLTPDQKQQYTAWKRRNWTGFKATAPPPTRSRSTT
jgi:hypothetical protein